MKVKIVHVVLFVYYLCILARVVVKLNRMESGDVKVVYINVEQFNVAIPVFLAHNRIKLYLVVSQRELAFHLAQTSAIVY